MKKANSFIYATALVLCLTLILCSCASQGRRACVEEIAELFADRYGTLPTGKLYSSNAEEWEDAFFSRELRVSLFGEDPAEVIDREIEFGVWLGSSLNSVAEFGIFVCRNRSDAEIASDLCLARIDRLRSPMYGTVDTDTAKKAFVCVGRTIVVYVALPDADSGRRAAEAVLD